MTSSQSARAAAVVAVGTMPEGAPACVELVRSLTATDLALVFVVHPNGEASRGKMLEALRQTAPFDVQPAVPGVELLPGRAYVAEQRHAPVLRDGKLGAEPSGDRHPVDAFMRSLSSERRAACVGVLLSGTTTDGVLGLQAIKAGGGVTFAQSDAPDGQDVMPRTAVGSGCVDFHLPAAAIGTEISALVGELQQLAGGVEQTVAEPPSVELVSLFRLLRAAHGVDFSDYRHTTIIRRIRRRMLLLKMRTIDEYARYLHDKPAEVDALFHDLLIRVTSFFRDPEVFDLLDEVALPEMLRDHGAHNPLRVWVPGCATGEEAYSLAIAALEYASSKGVRLELQIFATDVSEAAIDRARAGVYPENIDVSDERLERFFTKVEGGYEIDRAIRDMCIFARQNVTSDPPFSRVDLISCRNLLIYLEPPLQKRVIPIFHYALKPNGYLLLGTSETTGAASELFTPVDKKRKLYRKASVAIAPQMEFASPRASPAPGPERARRIEEPKVHEVEREADRVVLSRYAPPGLVVNEDHQIVQFRGHTGAYLEPSPGEASLNLFKMAREGLLIELRAALQRAHATDETVRTPVLSVRSNGGYREVVVQVVPMRGARRDPKHPRHYLVLFEDQEAGIIVSTPAPAGTGAPTDKLEQELASTREYLQSIIEEQEATNEELQSANEEILSSNEELQSINEELETAKEELQSTNEELTTVNEELQRRNVDLVQANNDLYNSLSSVDIPIVMLTRELTIRRFTPMAERVLRLIPTDIGRPVGDIKPRIDVADLEGLLREVLASNRVHEQEVRDQDGRTYSMRILPYRTLDNRIDGAVLCLVDIEALSRARGADVRWSRDAVELIEVLPLPIGLLDPALRLARANAALLALLGGDAATLQGKNLYDLGPAWSSSSLRHVLEELLDNGSAAAVDVRIDGLADDKATYRLHARRVRPYGAKLLAIWLSPERA